MLLSLIALLFLGFDAGVLDAAPASTPCPVVGTPYLVVETPCPVVEAALPAPGWQARDADNLAGLRDPRTLSNPAKVDHPSLMADTPEMKRMKRDRVDPRSAEGVQLKNAAATRVASSCAQAMQQSGHCSVWKTISHTDEREVPDLTEQVRRLL